MFPSTIVTVLIASYQLKMMLVIHTWTSVWVTSDMIFVQLFTLPDFLAKNFTPENGVTALRELHSYTFKELGWVALSFKVVNQSVSD